MSFGLEIYNDKGELQIRNNSFTFVCVYSNFLANGFIQDLTGVKDDYINNIYVSSNESGSDGMVVQRFRTGRPYIVGRTRLSIYRRSDKMVYSKDTFGMAVYDSSGGIAFSSMFPPLLLPNEHTSVLGLISSPNSYLFIPVDAFNRRLIYTQGRHISPRGSVTVRSLDLGDGSAGSGNPSGLTMNTPATLVDVSNIALGIDNRMHILQ